MYRDFKFGVYVDHSKSKPTDDTVSERDVVTSRDPFKFLVPLKYLWIWLKLETSNFVHKLAT